MVSSRSPVWTGCALTTFVLLSPLNTRGDLSMNCRYWDLMLEALFVDMRVSSLLGCVWLVDVLPDQADQILRPLPPPSDVLSAFLVLWLWSSVPWSARGRGLYFFHLPASFRIHGVRYFLVHFLVATRNTFVVTGITIYVALVCRSHGLMAASGRAFVRRLGSRGVRKASRWLSPTVGSIVVVSPAST